MCEFDVGQAWVWTDGCWCVIQSIDGQMLVYEGPFGWTGTCTVEQWRAWCRNGHRASPSELREIVAVRGSEAVPACN